MKKADRYTLSLGGVDGGYKVAVAGNDDGFLDGPLCRKRDKIDSKQNVNPLLLKGEIAAGVRPTPLQPSQPYREPR